MGSRPIDCAFCKRSVFSSGSELYETEARNGRLLVHTEQRCEAFKNGAPPRVAGELQVWWAPRLPMKEEFRVDVESVEEGAKLLDVLADYDLFQVEHGVRLDYSNAGGLVMWDESTPGWIDWCDEETGEDDPHEYVAMKKGER